MWPRSILTSPNWHLLKWLQVQCKAWAGNTGRAYLSPSGKELLEDPDREKHAGIHEEKETGVGKGVCETGVSGKWQGSG